jgi:hypothetical protein
VPEGYDPSPSWSETLTGGKSYETAEEALYGFLQESVFIESVPGLAISGYHKMELPDGSIAFGKPFEGDDSYVVTLVLVSETDDGWVADRWEGSGC